MTNTYIARCKTCKTATRIHIAQSEDYGHLNLQDLQDRLRLHCVACHRDLTRSIVKVDGRFWAETNCTSRCRNATGADCTCSCGGDEHGATWDGIFIAA